LVFNETKDCRILTENGYNVLPQTIDCGADVVMLSQIVLVLGLSVGQFGFAVLSVAGVLITDSQHGVDSASADRWEALQVSPPGAIRLEHAPVRVVLKSSNHERDKLSDQTAILSSGKRLYLVLKGLHCTSQPGTTFHLYLDLPEGISPSSDEVRHVGIINFFGTTPSDETTTAQKNPWRSFDITELVGKLAARKLLSDQTTVTIVASRRPEAGSNPAINSMALVAQ